MSEPAGSVSGLSDRELVDQVSKLADLPKEYRELLDEVIRRWHMALTAQTEVPQAKYPGSGKLLAATNLKLERPAKFSGDAKQLLNFLFEIEQFCDVIGVDEFFERVKLAVTLLSGRALTWWRSVASKEWAQLGVCTWPMFKTKIMMAFQDPNHIMRVRQQLLALQQHTSVQAYNAEFRGLLLEVRATMSEHDVLFSYLSGLKSTVQQQVMLHSPANIERAMELADHADATFWFSGPNRKPVQQHQQQQPRQPGFQRHDAAGGSSSFGRNLSGPVPMELGFAQRQQQRPQQRPQQIPLQHVKCFSCGQFGHLKRNCPQRPGKGMAAGMFSGPYNVCTPEPAPFSGFSRQPLPPPPSTPKNQT